MQSGKGREAINLSATNVPVANPPYTVCQVPYDKFFIGQNLSSLICSFPVLGTDPIAGTSLDTCTVEETSLTMQYKRQIFSVSSKPKRCYCDSSRMKNVKDCH